MLEKGLVLADLPGLSDTNQIRVRAARNYLRDADHTVVVSTIARVLTDEKTQQYLDEAFQRRRGRCVYMVATHSEVSISDVVQI